MLGARRYALERNGFLPYKTRSQQESRFPSVDDEERTHLQGAKESSGLD
jgi:hypothetical protein